MRVAVTGATGFTGSHLVAELSRRGYEVRALVRGTSDLAPIREYVASTVSCDLSEPDVVARALEGCDSMINVVSLGTGLADPLIAAVQKAGTPRVVFTSTTGIYTTLSPASKKIRLDAEEALDRSGLAFTLIRPTMIYGTPRDRNMWRLVRWINRFRFIPVAGSGEHKQQPVHVDDLAWALAESAQAPASVGKKYNLSGASVLTFNEVVDTIARNLGKRIWKVRLPMRPVHASIRTMERAGIRTIIKSEQISRLNEDKAFSYDQAARDFGYGPRSFDEGIRSEIAFLRKRDPE
jgi:nucleoside-diphosphate-sugar epimerase